uniref:Secreted protein n=1 Tax=Panagrellus redivivus TaxID=6233 RepID=A0A7E4V8D3_PANRE
MFVFSFYLFVLHLGAAVLVVLFRYTDLTNIPFPIDFYFVDATHFSVPWIFLFTQKDVQGAVKTVIRRYFCRNTTTTTTVTMMQH